MPSTVPEGVLSTAEDLINRVSVEDTFLSTAEGEEIASRGSEELSDSNREGEPLKRFSSPQGKGSVVKISVAESNDSDLVK